MLNWEFRTGRHCCTKTVILGRPDGPPMVKVWVVCTFCGWSLTFITRLRLNTSSKKWNRASRYCETRHKCKRGPNNVLRNRNSIWALLPYCKKEFNHQRNPRDPKRSSLPVARSSLPVLKIAWKGKCLQLALRLNWETSMRIRDIPNLRLATLKRSLHNQ